MGRYEPAMFSLVSYNIVASVYCSFSRVWDVRIFGLSGLTWCMISNWINYKIEFFISFSWLFSAYQTCDGSSSCRFACTKRSSPQTGVRLRHAGQQLVSGGLYGD